MPKFKLLDGDRDVGLTDKDKRALNLLLGALFRELMKFNIEEQYGAERDASDEDLRGANFPDDCADILAYIRRRGVKKMGAYEIRFILHLAILYGCMFIPLRKKIEARPFFWGENYKEYLKKRSREDDEKYGNGEQDQLNTEPVSVGRYAPSPGQVVVGSQFAEIGSVIEPSQNNDFTDFDGEGDFVTFVPTGGSYVVVIVGDYYWAYEFILEKVFGGNSTPNSSRKPLNPTNLTIDSLRNTGRRRIV